MTAAVNDTSAVNTVPPSGGSDPLATLRDPATIRLRSQAILQAVADGRSAHFRIDRTRLPAAAARVAALTRRRFPDLVIPFHSRWRHFEAGGLDRRAALEARLAGMDPAAAARARIDLTVVSVLLDAGAGAAWRYTDHAGDGAAHARSEGLGVASFRAFESGLFAVDSLDPLRADPVALQRLTVGRLAEAFQVMPSNPLVGLDGRVGLLQRLGALGERPGVLLYDALVSSPDGPRTEISAAALLGRVLRAFAPVWTAGPMVKGQPAGDVWPHRFAGCATANGPDVTTNGVVPFHKLSQWLSYSLLEPFAWAGVRVTELDALTGLPEYRNGGLLVDEGVIQPRDARVLVPADGRAPERRFRPGDEFIVEWRALTVALLDELAALVRAELGVTAAQLPLACILEGGSWAAGREVAAERRSGGVPPFAIDSDGTVF